MKRTQLLKWLLPVCLMSAGASWAAGYDASLDPNYSSGAATAPGAAADTPGGPQMDGAFGLGGQDFWVGAGDFYARGAPVGNSLVYLSFYYWYSTAGQHEAHFQLPNGSTMSVLRCFFNDTNAGLDGNVGMWRQWHNVTTNTPNNTNLASVSSAGSGGYQDPFAAPSPSLFKSRSGTNNEELNIYTLIANLPGGVTTVSLRGCRIFYNRQISPAPATATFTDVPVGSQFFAEVEALAASGITLGCTATTFCPTGTLTRLQMAAFLARALGLHWPAF